jgi:hypothetical protein
MQVPSQDSRALDQRAQGTCYGFVVRSALPFSYLRLGGAKEELRVEEGSNSVPAVGEPLYERLPRSDRPLHARIFADGDQFRLWTDRDGWFGIDPGSRIVTVPTAADAIRREERVWGYPAMLLFLGRGDLPIHASAVDVGGGALMFAAPGQHGKTTLATAFHNAGHRLLCDDISCCRVEPEVSVVPGPAVTRIRRDAYEQIEVPGVRIAWDEPERIHLAIDDDRRGDGEPVPLRGIVLLRGAPDLRFERVPAERALPDLWTLIFKLPRDAEWTRCFESTAALASSVPIWNLHRPLVFDSLPEIVDRIIETCLAPSG